MAHRPSRRTFGLLEERTSVVTGKVTSVRARYIGPDTEKHTRSFGDKMAAEALGLARRYNLYDDGAFTDLRALHRELDVAVVDAYD